ncbi:MAG: 1-deoxy-D-xylulose-5-phosphate reductoisomerase [Candidatus Omnitrophica bacterium]|jgi:1-deoxy-D-xylulose-5-phosphate reductoisomerase|nr:1-deoxy-D-xylulose-5-phosphate reductoisomerase [Candidatus Omnitrophota bacterium]
MKRVAILGSTGSIGTNALEVIRAHGKDFCVFALSAYSNSGLLEKQAQIFKPVLTSIGDDPERLKNICQDPRTDHVLIAISGKAALQPLLWAIDKKKEVSLANKESLVMAGPLVMARAAAKGVRIIPIDSEQSAIWQCLQGQDKTKIRRIYLTASGGPFRGMKKHRLKKISVKDALRHPRWKMGPKITIDSATLMNKGLEVIEAMHLFGVTADQIEVLVHPESVIHSMVEFTDGSVMAQLSVTDMRIPIQYALSYPKRLACGLAQVDFVKMGALHFEKPDMDAFKCLPLAFRAAHAAGTMPAVLNASNDVAVEKFAGGVIPFTDIPHIIEKVMDKHRPIKDPDLDEILSADAWARAQAGSIIERL